MGKSRQNGDARHYFNRELSWLEFNARVLEEANDPTVPLYDRLRFLGIVTTNVDEFFMVRVAGVKQQVVSGVHERSVDGRLPSEVLEGISARNHELAAAQYRCWHDHIEPELAEHRVRIKTPRQLTSAQREFTARHFAENVFPALTPLAVDPGHPFPHLRNKSVNIGILLQKAGQPKRRGVKELCLAVVQVPSVLPRLVRLPDGPNDEFILLDDLISTHVAELFPGYTVAEAATFRVTRNWDLHVDEDEASDLLNAVQEELRRRDRGMAVRLEVAASCSERLERTLREALNLDPSESYRIEGPLQINDLTALIELAPRGELARKLFAPLYPHDLHEADSLLDVIRRRDVLLHHPYESFDPVVRFIDEAADDPNVLAIKQTLYRAGADSPFVKALKRAAENGKQVAVLVEIKARFDEATNILWARQLEDSGVHVVYGLVGLKTHCKVAMVVRREGRSIQRYVHLGTGNYNPTTARIYTDLSLLTARQEVADDVTGLFNMLTGLSDAPLWKRFAVAPFDLASRIIELINLETVKALKGEPAHIRAKMNSLVDADVIDALYEASKAGVKIDLCVRGICCLRPGVKGLSENIRVRSIVSRFLEHSRIYAFGAGDSAVVYLCSADWMPRNFHSRVEVLFPVEEPALRLRVLNEIIALNLADNVKSRALNADGTYTRVPTPVDPARRVELQEALMARAVANAREAAHTDHNQADGVNGSEIEPVTLVAPIKVTPRHRLTSKSRVLAPAADAPESIGAAESPASTDLTAPKAAQAVAPAQALEGTA